MPEDLFTRKTWNPDRAYVNLMLRRAVAAYRPEDEGPFCSCAAGNSLIEAKGPGAFDRAAAQHYMYASHALHLFVPHDDPRVGLRRVFATLKPARGCCLDLHSPLNEVQAFLWQHYPRYVDPIFFALAVGELLSPVRNYQARENRRLSFKGGSVLAENVVAAAMPALMYGSTTLHVGEGPEPWRDAYKVLLGTPVLPPIQGGLWETSVKATRSTQADADELDGLIRDTDRTQEIVASAMPMSRDNAEARVVVSELLRLANVKTDLREALQHSVDSDDLTEIEWILDPDSLCARLGQIGGLTIHTTEFGPRVSHG
jgi:hypothetical protein